MKSLAFRILAIYCLARLTAELCTQLWRGFWKAALMIWKSNAT